MPVSFPLTWRILLRPDCITTSSKQTEFVGEMDDLENLGPRNNVPPQVWCVALVLAPGTRAQGDEPHGMSQSHPEAPLRQGHEIEDVDAAVAPRGVESPAPQRMPLCQRISNILGPISDQNSRAAMQRRTCVSNRNHSKEPVAS